MGGALSNLLGAKIYRGTDFRRKAAVFDFCQIQLGIEAKSTPAVFTYTLEHNVMRFAQAAVRVWGCQMDFADPKRTALEGIEALRNFLISIGMPKNFAELGAKEEDIEKLAHTCCYGDVNTGTVEGFATLDQKDVENIYKLMVF